VSDDGILCHHLDEWLEFAVFASSKGNGLVDLSGDWTMATITAGEITPPD